MKAFDYKEIDEEGSDILDVISKADKFNSWMYETIKPFCKGKVLEIGSGIGNISQYFLRDNQHIMLSDIREFYCDKLSKKYKSSGSLLGVSLMDLTHPDFDNQYREHLGFFDTVFALNVVEHIKEDQVAIDNCYKLLKKDGHLIILVPSYQFLYNSFDEALEHYRRYTTPKLKNIFLNTGFQILNTQYFNAVGILGWFISGKLQKNKSIPEGQMSLYNSLVPIIRIVDKVVFNKLGLSTIVVGKK